MRACQGQVLDATAISDPAPDLAIMEPGEAEPSRPPYMYVYNFGSATGNSVGSQYYSPDYYYPPYYPSPSPSAATYHEVSCRFHLMPPPHIHIRNSKRSCHWNLGPEKNGPRTNNIFSENNDPLDHYCRQKW